MTDDLNDRDDLLKDAFETLKLPGKDTVDLAEVLQELREKPHLQDKYPLAVQFLEISCKEELLGGVEYDTFKDEVDHYFSNEDDEEDEEQDEEPKPIEFKELKKKLSLYSGSRDKMEELWSTLKLDEYFTDECREFILGNILDAAQDA